MHLSGRAGATVGSPWSPPHPVSAPRELLDYAAVDKLPRLLSASDPSHRLSPRPEPFPGQSAGSADSCARVLHASVSAPLCLGCPPTALAHGAHPPEGS